MGMQDVKMWQILYKTWQILLHSTFHRSTKWVFSPFIKTIVIFYKFHIHNILDIQVEKTHGKKSKCVH